MAEQQKGQSDSKGRLTTWTPFLIGGVVVAATLLVGIGALASAPKGPTVGEPAPAFRVQLFGGETVTSDALQGQVVVLHFWASWCPPCHEEAPLFQELWQTYAPRGVQFVGLAYKDVQARSLDFLGAYGLGFPNGPDERNLVSRAYRVRGVPETYVIDAEGRLAQMYIGPINEADFIATLERLLAQ